jgi:GNAT superfamily N-acetyltransferase
MTDVRRAGPQDAEVIVATLAAAFQDDPFMVWALPAAQRRRMVLPAQFASMERHVWRRRREVWLADDGASVAVWADERTWRYGVLDGLRLAWPMLRLYGSDLGRLQAANRRVDRHHPREPHAYLELLGTDPARTGAGLATAVLRPVLARCDAERRAAYLWTARQENVAFYGRHGFTVDHVVDVAPGLRAWSCRREPTVVP